MCILTLSMLFVSEVMTYATNLQEDVSNGCKRISFRSLLLAFLSIDCLCFSIAFIFLVLKYCTLINKLSTLDYCIFYYHYSY